jgi:hypothetical protein
MTEPSPVCARYKLLTYQSREFDLDQTRRFFCAKCRAREMLFEMRVAANSVARSAVERIKPFFAGGPRRQLLYQG